MERVRRHTTHVPMSEGISHSETGNPKVRCFFLNPAGIGQHDPGMSSQLYEVQITKGANENDVFRNILIQLVKPVSGPWMYGKHVFSET